MLVSAYEGTKDSSYSNLSEYKVIRRLTKIRVDVPNI